MRWLAAIALALLVAACGPAEPSGLIRVAHPTQLAGGAWRLVDLNGRTPPPAPDVTLEFTADQVGGTAPCNGFGGAYRYDPSNGAFGIDRLISTKRACVAGPGNELEAAYFAGLRAVTEANVDADGRLVLVGAGVTMTFEVAGRPVLPPSSAALPGPS
jgi:heat shock protein HslJ